MQIENRCLRLVIACVFVLSWSSKALGATFAFDDIRYWVGTGENRAALVIDWADNADNPPALAWGYRWDGAATGADMLTDILAADDRLFAKLGGNAANPIAVYGLGYDTDDDGLFALSDRTTFNVDGVDFTSSSDLTVATDPGDYYAEGWYLGFWHYGIASSNPYDGGSWSDTQLGMASRSLVNGDWDSWTFSPTFNFASFATNPQVAASPYPPGDYNQDGLVDAADYAHWKSLFGSTTDPSADGNYNGIVDSADYTVWRNHIGGGMNMAAEGSLAAPEPGTALLAIMVLMICAADAQRRHRLCVAATRLSTDLD